MASPISMSSSVRLPAAFWSAPDGIGIQPSPYLRLSFAAARPEWIEACVTQLAGVVQTTPAVPE